MSLAGVTRWPSSCSGAMYEAVPSAWPLRVMRVWSAAVAMPRSASFTTPRSPSSTFAGLTSRWTIPASWACSSAEETAAITSTARRGRSGPSMIACPRVDPFTYSMTMRTPSSSATVS